MKKINFLSNPNKSMVNTSIEYKNEIIENMILIKDALPKTNVTLVYKGYSNNKEDIRSLTLQRCSYCGDKISTHTSTVEHYRPKGKLTKYSNEFLIKDGIWVEKHNESILSNYGYCLLGSSHENMLPACEACNMGQGKHDIYINGNIIERPSFGKKTRFAVFFKKKLGDKRENSLFINNHKNEKPLLFNPYLDEPNELFTYKYPLDNKSLINLSHIPIKVKSKLTRYKRIKSTYSINTLGLNRVYLCESRYQIFYELNKIKISLQKDIKIGVTTQNLASHSLDVYKYYNINTITLLGFTELILSPLINSIYYQIKKHSPIIAKKYFNENSTLIERLEELKIFGVNNIHKPSKLNSLLAKINANK